MGTTKTPFDLCVLESDAMVACYGTCVGIDAKLSLVANRFISAGEKIYTEKALLSVLGRTGQPLPEDAITKEVATLTSPSFSKKAALFWGLCPSKLMADKPDCKPISARRKGISIFKKHAISCQEGSREARVPFPSHGSSSSAGPGDKVRLGVYYLSGLMRHSCTPNVLVHDYSCDVVVCYAMRDTPEGTELTRSRIGLNACFHSRQNAYASKFSHRCKCWHCETCESNPEFLTNDDQYRESIAGMARRLESAPAEFSQALIITAQNLVTTLEIGYTDRGVHGYSDLGLLNTSHMRLCKFLLRQGDIRSAYKHLRLVVLYGALMWGWKSKKTIKYRQMLDKLERNKKEKYLDDLQELDGEKSVSNDLSIAALPIFDKNAASEEGKKGYRRGDKKGNVKGEASTLKTREPHNPRGYKKSIAFGAASGQQRVSVKVSPERDKKVKRVHIHTLPRLSVSPPLAAEPESMPSAASYTQSHWLTNLPCTSVGPPKTEVVGMNLHDKRASPLPSKATVTCDESDSFGSSSSAFDSINADNSSNSGIVPSSSSSSSASPEVARETKKDLCAIPSSPAHSSANAAADARADVKAGNTSSEEEPSPRGVTEVGIAAPPVTVPPNSGKHRAKKLLTKLSSPGRVPVIPTNFPLQMPANTRLKVAANRVENFHAFYGMPGQRAERAIQRSLLSASAIDTMTHSVARDSPVSQLLDPYRPNDSQFSQATQVSHHSISQFQKERAHTMSPPPASREKAGSLSPNSAQVVCAMLTLNKKGETGGAVLTDETELDIADLPISMTDMWASDLPASVPNSAGAPRDRMASDANGKEGGHLVIKLNAGTETKIFTYSQGMCENTTGVELTTAGTELKPLTAENPGEGSAFSQWVQTKRS